MVVIDSLAEIRDKIGLGSNDDGPTNYFFTVTSYRHMDKYVPMRDGQLSQLVYIDNNSITYMSPYASYQYFGMRKDGTRPINPENRDRSKHPLATSYWDEAMKTAEINEVAKEVQDFIRGR